MIGSIVLLFVLPDPLKPDIQLKFVNPKDPQLQIVNNSDEVATNIKWNIVAFNLTRINQNRQPLPIPATTFDFLTPQNASMPAGIFQTPLMKPFISEGDRVVGSISVNCPNCMRGRTYIIGIVWGNGDWYAEYPEMDNGNLLVPTNVAVVEEFAKDVVNRIPSSHRIPVSARD
jgi:hypothetical protein